MAKTTTLFKANLELNEQKGGAWIAVITLSEHQQNGHDLVLLVDQISAWKNASAAKRWIKEKVQELTPRKSVKLVATRQDANNKPVAFAGELTYKK